MSRNDMSMKRMLFLTKTWELASGHLRKSIELDAIANELGLQRHEASAICDDCAYIGVIKKTTLTTLELTSYGLDIVDQITSNPDEIPSIFEF